MPQQPGDLAAYQAVDALIHGADPTPYAETHQSYGRWEAEVRLIIGAALDDGQEGALFRYMKIVYHNQPFAELMVTLGFQPPKVHWEPHEMPTCPSMPQQVVTSPPKEEPAPPRKDNGPRALTGREDEVWEVLRELGEATTAEIAAFTDQNRSNVHRRLQRLCAMGRVVRVQTARGVTYRKVD